MHSPRIKRTRKFLNKIADLQALGFSNTDIANELNKQFNMNMGSDTVKNIIKKEAIFRKQIIKTDEDVRALYKETLPKLVDRANANLKILEEVRKILVDRFDELKQDIPVYRLFEFIREISGSIKTQNDSIRTMNDLLKRIEVETQEVRINTVQAVQETISMLKDFEKMGYLIITPDFYRSELGKHMKEKEKEDSDILDEGEHKKEKEVENE